MKKLKNFVTGEDEKEDSKIVAQISDATTLSWSTRIKGFLICFILGVAVSIVGCCLFILPNGMIIFGVMYTVGNILALLSTCFLMGPLNQLKKMFAKTRIIATIAVFVMLVLTLVCAFAVKIYVLVIICCVLQFLAFTWYSLSYIPFARDVVMKCFGSCME